MILKKLKLKAAVTSFSYSHRGRSFEKAFQWLILSKSLKTSQLKSVILQKNCNSLSQF